jgi:hypothetical protein
MPSHAADFSAAEIVVNMPDTASSISQPDALRRLLDPILAGDDVTLFIKSDDGRELLDAAAECLATMRCRVLRAAGTFPEGLSLSVLMAQVTGLPVPDAQNDEALKRGFQALTALDGTCDRIVLLVSDANTLRPSALRYIQLACRAGTNLQLVLAGKRGFLDLLAPNEFSHLRERLATGPIVTPTLSNPASPAAAAPLRRAQPVHDALAPQALEQTGPWPSRPMLSSLYDASPRKRLAAVAGIGLGMAACVALTIWAGEGSKPVTLPSQQAMLVVEPPVVPETAVAAAPEVRPVDADIPAPAVSAAQPAPADVPMPEAQQPPATTQEADIPAVPLPAGPPLVLPSNPINPVKTAGRKAMPAQQRLTAARAPVFNTGSVTAWEDPYPPPPRDWRPLAPPQAVADSPDQPKSFIGTYATNANGTRAFRFSH